MNELTTSPADANALANGASAAQLMMDPASMTSMMRLADLMASGKSTLPAHFRNSPGDCMAVVMQSMQWGLNPFAVAQKTHLVNGTLGYEAQLVNAVISASGVVTKDDFDYEYFGPWEKVIGKFQIKKNADGKEYRQPGWSMADEDGCGVRISATIRATGKVKVLEVLLAQARVRNSTLWADDPKQQMAYLAVKKWARLHAPGVILGVYTPDEFEQDVQREQKTQHMGAAEVVTPAEPSALAEAADKAVSQGVAAYNKFWDDISKGGGTTRDQRQILHPRHDERKARARQADADRTIDQPPAGVAPAQTDDEFLAGLDKAPT
jgi:hypothetical protein